MSSSKEEIYALFYPSLDTAVDKWRGRRVIPYSRAYADAYASFETTRKEAVADRDRRNELYIAVALLAGTAVCGLGPVAAAIAAGNRSARYALVTLAQTANRLGIASRGSAWVVMTKFTFGGVPQVATAIWSTQGKTILKKHMSKFSNGVVKSDKVAADVQSPIRDSTKRDKMPIEYFLELDGLLLRAKNAITDCADDLIADAAVTAEEFEEFCEGIKKSNLIAKKPDTDLSGPKLSQLANEMEMALWATAAISWKTMVPIKVQRGKSSTGYNSFTNRGSTISRPTAAIQTVDIPKYSDYLDEDRILERIDKVAKNLGMKKFHYAEFEESRNSQGETILRSHTTGVATKSWDDHFGYYHSAADKDLLIKWAKSYVHEKAQKTMRPLDLL